MAQLAQGVFGSNPYSTLGTTSGLDLFSKEPNTKLSASQFVQNVKHAKDRMKDRIGESGFMNWLFCSANEGRWKAPIYQLIVNLVLFLIFMGIYAAHMKNNPDSWSFPDDSRTNVGTDAAYFAAVTATTVGFGDVVPTSRGAMFLVWFQITLFFAVNLIWSLDCDVLGWE